MSKQKSISIVANTGAQSIRIEAVGSSTLPELGKQVGELLGSEVSAAEITINGEVVTRTDAPLEELVGDSDNAEVTFRKEGSDFGGRLIIKQ